MTDKEKVAYADIVEAEADPFQSHYLDGLLRCNDKTRAPLSERCALPAICRLWRMQ